MMVKVGAPPNLGGQIAPGGAHALVVGVAVRDWRIAVGEHRILVGDVAPTLTLDRGHHAAGETWPSLRRITLHMDRSGLVVQRPVEVAIGFELLEIRQHVLPAPAAGAALSPAVIVRRQAAQRRHAVDRGGAADDAALIVDAPRPVVRRIAGAGPNRAVTLRPDEIAAWRRRWRQRYRVFRAAPVPGVVRAGLDQQHLAAGSLSRAASTQPAEPAPTTMWSKIRSIMTAAASRISPPRVRCAPPASGLAQARVHAAQSARSALAIRRSNGPPP